MGEKWDTSCQQWHDHKYRLCLLILLTCLGSSKRVLGWHCEGISWRAGRSSRVSRTFPRQPRYKHGCGKMVCFWFCLPSFTACWWVHLPYWCHPGYHPSLTSKPNFFSLLTWTEKHTNKQTNPKKPVALQEPSRSWAPDQDYWGIIPTPSPPCPRTEQTLGPQSFQSINRHCWTMLMKWCKLIS